MNFRRINVRDCQGVLWDFWEHFQTNAFISFEGVFTNLNLTSIPGVSFNVSPVLRRQTIKPKLDFCVVPINAQTVFLLKQQLSHSGVLGRNGQIIHVQISQANELVFLACDNFHYECSVVSKTISVEFLEALVQQGVLRSYERF